MRLPSPWLQGMVGAVALGGIAAARLAYESEHRATPAPRAAAAAAARLVVVETEPNDTAGAAQPIARLPVEVRGELLAGDRDVFRFRIDEPGAHLIAAWMEGAARARLRVTRADGSELTSAETPERIGALALIRGDYFVTLEAATKGSYRLMVEKRPWVRGLDWEPNDDPDHALELARLEPSATLETGANEIARYRAVGWWSRRSDVDCYRVPLLVPPTGADFRIELVPPVGVKAHLVVYDTGDPGARINPQRLIDVTGTVAGERTIVPALGERSWQPEYTMCVDSGGGENFMDSYTLEIRAFTPKGPFEFEPNDTRRTASALPRDVPVSGYLTRGDVDWFRISAAPSPRMRARLELPAGVSAQIAFFDEIGRERERIRCQAGGSIAADEAAVAFIELRALEGGNTEKPYRLVIESLGSP